MVIHSLSHSSIFDFCQNDFALNSPHQAFVLCCSLALHYFSFLTGDRWNESLKFSTHQFYSAVSLIQSMYSKFPMKWICLLQDYQSSWRFCSMCCFSGLTLFFLLPICFSSDHHLWIVLFVCLFVSVKFCNVLITSFIPGNVP